MSLNSINPFLISNQSKLLTSTVKYYELCEVHSEITKIFVVGSVDKF